MLWEGLLNGVRHFPDSRIPSYFSKEAATDSSFAKTPTQPCEPFFFFEALSDFQAEQSECFGLFGRKVRPVCMVSSHTQGMFNRRSVRLDKRSVHLSHAFARTQSVGRPMFPRSTWQSNPRLFHFNVCHWIYTMWTKEIRVSLRSVGG